MAVARRKERGILIKKWCVHVNILTFLYNYIQQFIIFLKVKK